MTTVRFLFHKPKGEHGVGKAIMVWTWILGCFYNWKVLKYNYSHEELWLPDENGKFWQGKRVCWQKLRNGMYICPLRYESLGYCFSSTTRGGAKGVRFAPASEVLKHLERWDYIEVEVDPYRLEVAMEEAKKLEGKKYDYLALFGFFQPFVMQDSKKWYCSEICDWLKVLLRIYPKRKRRVSPRRSAYILAKLCGEPKALR